jgi:general secretion pathway protein G
VIQTALEAFRIETGRYPTASQGLQALITPPPGLKGWDGPYLKSVSVDTWGQPYVYRQGAKVPGGGYVLLSVGPDGIEGTADDIRVAGR